MEIVIKVPEKIYKSIRDNEYCGIIDSEMYNAIANGIPLPKGHGRLIDADKFKKYLQESMADNAQLFKTQKYKALAEMVTKGICKDIDEAHVVVEADKEEQNNDE